MCHFPDTNRYLWVSLHRHRVSIFSANVDFILQHRAWNHSICCVMAGYTWPRKDNPWKAAPKQPNDWKCLMDLRYCCCHLRLFVTNEIITPGVGERNITWHHQTWSLIVDHEHDLWRWGENHLLVELNVIAESLRAGWLKPGSVTLFLLWLLWPNMSQLHRGLKHTLSNWTLPTIYDMWMKAARLLQFL